MSVTILGNIFTNFILSDFLRFRLPLTATFFRQMIFKYYEFAALVAKIMFVE